MTPVLRSLIRTSWNKYFRVNLILWLPKFARQFYNEGTNHDGWASRATINENH